MLVDMYAECVANLKKKVCCRYQCLVQKCSPWGYQRSLIAVERLRGEDATNCRKLSAIDVTGKAIFERLVLVPGANLFHSSPCPGPRRPHPHRPLCSYFSISLSFSQSLFKNQIYLNL